jgi:signal transduction histidine kinase
MGIRWRLVTLSVGIAVPLTLVGLMMLWGLWQENRSQLDQSIETQAELAAVAFERWIDGQRQPLTALAAQVAARREPPLTFQDGLPFLVNSRPHWLDLHLLGADNSPQIKYPDGAESLRPEIVNMLRAETGRRQGWAVGTDWTRGEGHPVIAIAVPVETGQIIIARIDGEALGAIFSNIRFADKAVIVVFDSKRRVLYRTSTDRSYFGTDRSKASLFVPLTEQPRALVEAVSPYDGINRVYGLVRVDSTDCVVAIGAPTSALYRPARRQLSLYLLFSLLALFAALFAALFIARRTIKPVRQLRDAAKDFGSGDLSARALVTGSGELEELGTVFNHMAEEIEKRTERLTQLDRLKSEFVGGVSHELRTPLTTIKTLTRVLLRGEVSAEERREYLETIAAECDRQIDLVLNLLDLSRIEAGAFKVNCSGVDLTAVVHSCIMIARHAAEARGQRLGAELPDGLPLALSDRDALRRVLCSLIENAIKYTPEGGRITVSASAVDDTVAISVADTGCGINAEDVPHVFEKFYRGRPAAPSAAGSSSDDDSAIYRNAPGVGLGLYLARTIVSHMGGSIRLESSADCGSIFTVYLPAYHGAKEIREGRHAETAARG